MYETAVLLYDRFLPLVQDHLATSPFAKVAAAAADARVGWAMNLQTCTATVAARAVDCPCSCCLDQACVSVTLLADAATRPPHHLWQVAFTGHSLGGSLGTVLMLMYVRRGVLPKSAISPVYT